MTIEIGKQYRFDYPKVWTTLPDYTAHIGLTVTVLRSLTADEADINEEPMFLIRATDAWEGHAFESELVDLP